MQRMETGMIKDCNQAVFKSARRACETVKIHELFRWSCKGFNDKQFSLSRNSFPPYFKPSPFS